MEIELGAYIYHGGGYRPMPPDVAPSLKKRLLETSQMVRETNPTLFYTVVLPRSMQVCVGCFDREKVAGEISGTPAQDDRRGLGAIIGIEIADIREAERQALSAIGNQAALADLLFNCLDAIQTALHASTPDAEQASRLWSTTRREVHERIMAITGATGLTKLIGDEIAPPRPSPEALDVLDVPDDAGGETRRLDEEKRAGRAETVTLTSMPAKQSVPARSRGLRLLVIVALLLGLINTVVLVAHLAGWTSDKQPARPAISRRGGT